VITSLRTRLTLSYMLVALLCVLMVSVLANGVLESSFRRYVKDSLEKNAQAVVTQVGSQVNPDGSWDEPALSAVGMSALEQGLIVKVSSPSGRTVWDATVHNNGMCVAILSHMAQNMASRYPRWHGSYTENVYPVRASFRTVGSVTIGYYGPFYLSDQDLTFINSLNRLLLWITLAALALALGIGLFMARRISVPLGRVAAATQKIAAGDRGVLITHRSNVRELDGIATAVNDLSLALKEQEALRRRLTADMAHELRTPLATLQSHLEALLDGIWEPDQARLAGLHEEILRINRMVSDLENLARFEGDTASLRRSSTDIRALVAGIVRNHEPQFREKGVFLCLETPGGPPACGPEIAEDSPRGTADGNAPVDSDKISQAVINLLSNALKFTAPGGRVSVRVTGGAEGVRIDVADTGIGISAEDLPRVFERFYRADSSRSRATGGAGIGLSIAKAIIEAHGGSIRARSEPGKGSEFSIILPRGAAA
jgi:two-component system, OmpR family, sensor histidine kinase BaeS